VKRSSSTHSSRSQPSGSTRAGRRIAELAAKTQSLVLELGGNAPVLVFPTPTRARAAIIQQCPLQRGSRLHRTTRILWRTTIRRVLSASLPIPGLHPDECLDATTTLDRSSRRSSANVSVTSSTTPVQVHRRARRTRTEGRLLLRANHRDRLDQRHALSNRVLRPVVTVQRSPVMTKSRTRQRCRVRIADQCGRATSGRATRLRKRLFTSDGMDQ